MGYAEDALVLYTTWSSSNASSSHIIKPPIIQYPHSAENEYFCMRLAERVGLSVSSATLLHKRKRL